LCLVLCENACAVGDVKSGEAVRGREGAKVLRAGAPWEENFKVIRETRLSRYPVVAEGEFPVGILHVKDLLYEGPEKMALADLKKMARPFLTVHEEVPLEGLLADFQRQR